MFSGVYINCPQVLGFQSKNTAHFLLLKPFTQYKFSFHLVPITAGWPEAVWIQSLPNLFTHGQRWSNWTLWYQALNLNHSVTQFFSLSSSEHTVFWIHCVLNLQSSIHSFTLQFAYFMVFSTFCVFFSSIFPYPMVLFTFLWTCFLCVKPSEF